MLAKTAYLIGLTVNEVPHLAAGLPLAVATALAIASGEIGFDGSSLLPAVRAVAVGASVVALARRGIRAWPTVSAAVGRARLDVPDRPRGWAWRTLFTPIPFRPRQVVRIADLRYGEHRRQRLDVYHHRDRPSDGPVLLYLHDGGYCSGGKHREGRALLYQLAAAARSASEPTIGCDHRPDSKTSPRRPTGADLGAAPCRALRRRSRSDGDGRQFRRRPPHLAVGARP